MKQYEKNKLLTEAYLWGVLSIPAGIFTLYYIITDSIGGVWVAGGVLIWCVGCFLGLYAMGK